MRYIEILGDKVLSGGNITREEALKLYEQSLNELDELCNKADEIRKYFCADKFDICTIMNAKSGRCSENCKFCAQSAHYKSCVEEYSLLSAEEISAQAQKNYKQGIAHYGIVTAGKRLSDSEVDAMCDAVRKIKDESKIGVCVSFGLLNEAQYKKLKDAGVTRVHNNLETSRRNFPNVCTTHTFDDKINAIKAAQAAEIEVCSGGIMGIGETIEDRVDMAFTLKELGVKSVPVNILNPIKGTPLENNKKLDIEDMRRIVAVYRFILPDAFIRLAGGRGLMSDKGLGCFISGANAAISGDMLTTAGITVETDIKLLDEIGYKIYY